MRPLKTFHLPRRRSVLTLLTLTSNSLSTASLICGLVAVMATLNTTLLNSDALVAFSVMSGDRHNVVMARIAGDHFNRASKASTAARVSTSLRRRIMS